ncbi:hypothetical protein [Streptomyces swartbergensis]|uniref:Uncharacterized protein n=1 Tax=Streptomyces swartbergensis TaxID=487165 RepID=A0A243SAN9_9ACTN|nr:hypothetical protein [Streptomyces swartbergensis]OUD04709.1 hypothetical protein CA983_02850 [Streptomyces swartbergensis]
MTKPGPSMHRDLASALKQQAKRAGERAPSVRGADWRTATVTAENGDGTVDADGVPDIRCMETYSQPAVGDLIAITQSSSGNWLAWGRTTTTDPDWTPLTLAAGYTNPGHGYTASYLRAGRRIWMRGRIGPTSGTIPDGDTLATIPSAIRPGVAVAWAVARDAGAMPSVCRLEITAAGALRTFQSTNLPTWVCLDGISYTI